MKPVGLEGAECNLKPSMHSLLRALEQLKTAQARWQSTSDCFQKSDGGVKLGDEGHAVHNTSDFLSPVRCPNDHPA